MAWSYTSTEKKHHTIGMGLILIGEAPSKRGDPTKPLDYRIFDGLVARKMNLFYTREPIESNGGKWSEKKARAIAARLEVKLSGSEVLFVGKRVARAFGYKGRYFEWRLNCGGFRCATFPHPSGLNRWWNPKENRETAHRFLRENCNIYSELRGASSPTYPEYGKSPSPETDEAQDAPRGSTP